MCTDILACQSIFSISTHNACIAYFCNIYCIDLQAAVTVEVRELGKQGAVVPSISSRMGRMLLPTMIPSLLQRNAMPFRKFWNRPFFESRLIYCVSCQAPSHTNIQYLVRHVERWRQRLCPRCWCRIFTWCS